MDINTNNYPKNTLYQIKILDKDIKITDGKIILHISKISTNENSKLFVYNGYNGNFIVINECTIGEIKNNTYNNDIKLLIKNCNVEKINNCNNIFI